MRIKGYLPEIIDGLWKAEQGMNPLILALREDADLQREAKTIQRAFRDRRRALEDLDYKAMEATKD